MELTTIQTRRRLATRHASAGDGLGRADQRKGRQRLNAANPSARGPTRGKRARKAFTRAIHQREQRTIEGVRELRIASPVAIVIESPRRACRFEEALLARMGVGVAVVTVGAAATGDVRGEVAVVVAVAIRSASTPSATACPLAARATGIRAAGRGSSGRGSSVRCRHSLPPFGVPPFEVPPFDVPPFEVPPFEVPPFEVPPFEVPPFAVPPFAVPPFEVPPFALPPFELPPLVLPPTATPPPIVPPFAVCRRSPRRRSLRRRSSHHRSWRPRLLARSRNFHPTRRHLRCYRRRPLRRRRAHRPFRTRHALPIRRCSLRRRSLTDRRQRRAPPSPDSSIGSGRSRTSSVHSAKSSVTTHNPTARSVERRESLIGGCVVRRHWTARIVNSSHVARCHTDTLGVFANETARHDFSFERLSQFGSANAHRVRR